MFERLKSVIFYIINLIKYIKISFKDIIVNNERHTYSFINSSSSVKSFLLLASKFLSTDLFVLNNLYDEFISNIDLRYDYKRRFGKELDCSGGRFVMYVLIRLLTPKIVVENGSFTGKNTTIIYHALLQNKIKKGVDFQLFSIDIVDCNLKSFGPCHFIYLNGIEDFLNKFQSKIDFYYSDGERTIESEIMELNFLTSKSSNNSILITNKALFSNVFLEYAIDNEINFMTFMESPLNSVYRGNNYTILNKTT